MTSDQLQHQLNETWYRDQSADDAHDAIWGEPFDGYTVKIYDAIRALEIKAAANEEAALRSPQHADWSNGVAKGMREAIDLLSNSPINTNSSDALTTKRKEICSTY